MPLVDKIFIENDAIFLNDFFKSVHRVYNHAIIILMYVQDFFSDEFFIEDSLFK